MFDQDLRPLKDRLLLPLARRLEHVSPNAMTLAGCAVGLAAAAAAGLKAYPAAIALWAGNRCLDGLDGTIARLTGRTSDLGGYLDLMADFLVYLAVPTGLVLGQPSLPGFQVLAWLFASFYVNLGSWVCLSALLERRSPADQTCLRMQVGLVEGAETALLYSLALADPSKAIAILGGMACLVWLSAALRVRWALGNLP